MDDVSVLSIAVGLAMDAPAVSLGIGATLYVNARRPIFRLSFHFGLFQFLFPLLGWLGGVPIQRFLGGVDHWVAFGLPAFVGGRMVRSGFLADAHRKDHGSTPITCKDNPCKPVAFSVHIRVPSLLRSP